MFDTNTRAHSEVRAGTPAAGKVRVDNAEGEGLLRCTTGRSDSEGAPKEGRAPLRWPLAERARFDMVASSQP